MSWIAVGLRADVPAGTVVPRRVAQTDLAIWCSAAGVFHAWGDRCPHRGMRLSHGFVRGETLACIYHGWQYDQNGACAYIPAHPELVPPKTICATDYACQERGGLIWVALGSAQDAPPEVGGRLPLRSMDVAVSATDVAARFGQDPASIITVDGGFDLTLALQPSTDDTCILHALAGPEQDRKQASRHLEKLRAEMEGAT